MNTIKSLIVGWVLLVPILVLADTVTTGQAIATAFNKRDVDAMMRMIDRKAIGQLVLKDLNIPDREADQVSKGFAKGMRSTVEFSMRTMESVKGTARFMRTGKRGAKTFALVRHDLGEQGTDYVEYYINAEGKVEDWYAYGMATLYSTSASFNLATILKTNSTLFGIFGTRIATEADLKPFTELRTQLLAQNFAAAYKTLDTFPEEFRKNRQWALMRVVLGGRIDDATHRSALRYLAQNFGTEADLQFMLTDHYFFEKQYDRALASIASLEHSIGGEDAATASLRGGILTSSKRFDEAALACRQSMALEADNEAGYWCLVSVGTTAGNGKIAVEGLKAYEKAFGMQLDLAKIGALEHYKDIARTPEFLAWKKSRP
jgi:hypothetical protein